MLSVIIILLLSYYTRERFYTVSNGELINIDISAISWNQPDWYLARTGQWAVQE